MFLLMYVWTYILIKNIKYIIQNLKHPIWDYIWKTSWMYFSNFVQLFVKGGVWFYFWNIENLNQYLKDKKIIKELSAVCFMKPFNFTVFDVCSHLHEAVKKFLK